MDAEDKLVMAIEKLQEIISELKSDLKVTNTKQEELLHKYIYGARRGDEFAERLRIVESTQAVHKGYFTMSGAVLLLCISGLVGLFLQ